MDRIWLCLHFDRLPIEVFTRLESASDSAVVVFEGGRAVFLNEKASAIGAQPGNSLDTILALDQSVVSFERNREKELTTLSHLGQWAFRFTPNISIRPPDALLLDVTGCLKLFRGLENLKNNIAEALDQLGYRAAIAVNSTPLAALYTARAKAPDHTDVQRLPVEHLRVEARIIESLQQMGIGHIGRLFDMPQAGLTRRFGVFFTDHLQRLTGKKADPQKFITPEPNFFSEIVFLADVTDVGALIFPVKRLLGEFCDFLNARQLHVNRFSWHLLHRAHPAKSFSVYLTHPENDQSLFLALTQLHLDKIDDVEEVDCLRLSASVFFPAETASGDLFRKRDEMRQNDHGTRLLNMLKARLGPQTCFGLSLANDHRPEKAWQSVHPDRPGSAYNGASDHRMAARPFYLLDPPRALKTTGGEPVLGGKLELLKGPERIDFGWWDRPSPLKPRRRDYYVARHTSGALYWIFQYGNDEKWYLHGIFS